MFRSRTLFGITNYAVLAFKAVAFVTGLFVFGSQSLLATQQKDRETKTVWDGVYTIVQAERGKDIYEFKCGHCHREDLGGVDGPALVGGGFLRNWLEDSLSSLYLHVYYRMPGDLVGTLSSQESVDLTSFLLFANGFPAGLNELVADEDLLKGILITGKDGPGPVPNFSLVKVIGCLKQDLGSEWIVTHGTEPVRARNSGVVPVGQEVLEVISLGTENFHLMNVAFFKPETLKDQKVEIEGLLIRQPKETRLNVTSLKTVGVECE